MEKSSSFKELVLARGKELDSLPVVEEGTFRSAEEWAKTPVGKASCRENREACDSVDALYSQKKVFIERLCSLIESEPTLLSYSGAVIPVEKLFPERPSQFFKKVFKCGLREINVGRLCKEPYKLEGFVTNEEAVIRLEKRPPPLCKCLAENKEHMLYNLRVHNDSVRSLFNAEDDE